MTEPFTGRLAFTLPAAPGLVLVLALTLALPVLPGVNALEFTVWTGMWEAAGAGAVRATTGRLIIAAGGVATCLPVLAAPK